MLKKTDPSLKLPSAGPVLAGGSEESALLLLLSNRIMAVSTLRPDGWPQTTFVGYANEGFTLYFVIFRASQKFANISADDRISIAIGQQPADMHEAKAFYAAAFASEVTTAEGREHAWRTLVKHHPNLAGSPLPDLGQAAIMRAECRQVSVIDYTKGLGHIDTMTITNGAVEL